MEQEIIDLLKSVNNGKVSGSKKKLAELLNVSKTIVGLWCNKTKEPSLDMINKMSVKLKRPEKELQKIFALNSNNNNSFNNCTPEEIRNYKDRIKLLEEKINFLEEKIKFYKEQYKIK